MLVLVDANILLYSADPASPFYPDSVAELTSINQLFPFLPDTPAIYPEWERLVVQHLVLGKNGHDARYVAAMNIHGITHLLTDNKDDFKRFTNITAFSTADV